MSQSEEYIDIKIPTYVINLEERTDRLKHILGQFKTRSEFDLHIVTTQKYPIGAVGLWKNIIRIINMAIDNDEDVIIICEDDHQFTNEYNRSNLIQNIIEAHEQGVNLLSGGVGGFHQVIPITPNRLWVDTFWSTQFIVVYKKFFNTILDEPFADNDTADGKFSEMTSNKMFLYPFISVQKDFGYSDVTKSNNSENGKVEKLFEHSNLKLKILMDAYFKYEKLKTSD